LANLGYESTDDAYLRAAQVSISPNVSGRVIEVSVRDNQPVHWGDTLIRLDERPFRIAVENARADIANTRLQIESLSATYWQRMADLRSAQSALEYHRGEYERQTRLLAGGISPIAGRADPERAQPGAAERGLRSTADQCHARQPGR
jgi:membrane fusion protein (multidrug efflux system)